MPNPLPEDQLPPVPNHCRVWNYNGRYVLLTAGGEFDQLCEHDCELLRAIADWLERANGVEAPSIWKKQSETPAPPGKRVLYRGRCYGEELRNWEEWMEVPK